VIPWRTAAAHLHAAFHQPGSRLYRWVQGAVWALIVLSIVLLGVEALVPEGGPARTLVHQTDRWILTLFAIEILLRVGSHRPPALKVFQRPPMGRLRTHLVARLAYLARPIMLVDILAVLALLPELRGLRALRLLRLLRTTRVFRYRNPFAIVLQAFEENSLLFALAFSVLGVTTLLGGVSIYMVEVKINPTIESLVDGMWWALVTITTVGFGDITPVTLLGRIIGAVLMVAGMFTLALFAGIIGSSLVSGVLSIREEQFRMSDYVNHVVVCGYDESTHLLLEALTRELDLTQIRVVFFDDHERPRDLPPEFLWVQGDPTKESELDKVRLTHAAAVIVSGERDTTPQAADARTILTTFTIRSYLHERRRQVRHRRYPLYIVVEILDSENVDHARSAGADEVIETRKIGYSMLAHAVGYHGTATAMSRVLISGSHNVYIGRLPGDRREPLTFGELLVELQLTKRGGLIVGLRTPSGREIINPPKSYVVDPDTRLLYLAEKPLLEPPR
jgi:voltage-gated potassium channel